SPFEPRPLAEQLRRRHLLKLLASNAVACCGSPLYDDHALAAQHQKENLRLARIGFPPRRLRIRVQVSRRLLRLRGLRARPATRRALAHPSLEIALTASQVHSRSALTHRARRIFRTQSRWHRGDIVDRVAS